MRPFRPALLAGAVVVLAACSDRTPVAVSAPDRVAPLLSASAHGLPDAYIVVLREGADPHSVAAAAGATPRFVYAAALNGFAAALNAGQLAAVQHDPAVEYVEQDQVMHVQSTQSSAPWNLDRIDQRNLPLDGLYHVTATGASVRAYVIDSGIYTAHTQFGGRAQNVYDYAGGSGADCNGHGTHVAGIVGAATYGVAKGVLLRGVRVVDCNGSGTTSGIIAGVDWVRTNAVKPAVANMSVGGGLSSTLNTAVNNLANSGVFISVGAGAEAQSACNVSPASASAAFTTAASTSTDQAASYSNFGSCVDAYAPGSSIISTWLNGGTNTLSGTSMAAPHMAGVGALYKATFGDAASSTVDAWIKNNATVGVLSGVPTGTPNRLLYKSTL